MSESQTIAILLKHKNRFADAGHCAAMLMQSGARVIFYCLCRERCRSGLWNLLPLLRTKAPCFTDNPQLAAHYGIDCLSDAGLVQHLKTVDWVIPF